MAKYSVVRFQAPEQFRGAAEVSSDVYAAGGTLLFLLTGNFFPLHLLFSASICISVATRADLECVTSYSALSEHQQFGAIHNGGFLCACFSHCDI